MPPIRTLAGLALITLLIFAPKSFAFIDTSGLSNSIKQMEQGVGGGNASGLEGLLENLQKAAGENKDAYLEVNVGGNTTTMWDIAKSAWFYEYVRALTELGIASGYKDAHGKLTGSFGPGNNVTRAEAMKMALGAAGVDPSSCQGEPSHPGAKGHWARSYVVCAEAREFGLQQSHDLNGSASRAEVLHYILRAFGATVPSGTPPFADSASHTYKDDIAYAYALEIISGDAGGDTFRPNDPVNRAEVAKMLKLSIERL